MIVLNNYAFDPIYTRITVYRMYIFAEIAVNADQIPDSVKPGAEIIIPIHGIMYVDSAIVQGTTMIIRAYDPMAYVAKHTVCTTFNSVTYWRKAGKVTAVLSNLIHDQTRSELLEQHHIEYKDAVKTSTKDMSIDIRYDMLYDVYTQFPERYDPQLRMRITPAGGAGGNTAYQPESYATPPPVAISADYAIDYANFQITPNQVFVSRPAKRVPDQDLDDPHQIYVDIPHSGMSSSLAEEAAQAALDAAAAQAQSTTIRILTADLPADIYPGDQLSMPSNVLPDTDTGRIIDAIEYTTSSRGDIAYVMCGGKILGIADRINAIIAADYAARY